MLIILLEIVFICCFPVPSKIKQKQFSKELIKQSTQRRLGSVVLNRRMATSFPEETGGKEKRGGWK